MEASPKPAAVEETISDTGSKPAATQQHDPEAFQNKENDPPHDPVEAESGCGVPIRVVLTLIISIVAAVSVIVAFTPTYLEGMKATRSTMGDLRRSFVARTQEGGQNYFQGSWAVMEELNNAFASGAASTANTTHMISMMWNIAMRRNASISQFTHIDFFGALKIHGVDVRFLDRFGALYLYTNATHVVAHPFVPQLPIVYRAVKIVELPYVASTRVSPVEKSLALHPSASIHWTETFWGYNSPQKEIYALLRSSAGLPVGALVMAVTPGNLNLFLQQLGLRARASACIVDGDPGNDIHRGVLMANSWGENTTDVTPLYQNTALPDWMRLRMKYLHNISNSRMEEAVGAIGETVMTSSPLPFASSYGSGRKKTFVDIVGITGPGLNLRVILVMPEIDFLEEVYQTQITTIIIVVVLFVAMVVVAAVVGYLMTVPLKELESRMLETASLRDESTDALQSAFSEVASLQRAYYRMRFELNRLKSYVPQSVLYQNQGDDEEDDEDEKSALSKSGANVDGSACSGGSSSHRRGSFSGMMSQHSHGPTARVGLNLSNEVSTRRVTAAVFNLSGFHRIATQGPGRITSTQTTFLNLIAKHCKENKGVVDFFQGDHVLCTFNAVGNAAAHAKRAAVTALTVQRELMTAFNGAVHLTCGISSGQAHVGNMGTDTMRRFNVIGPVVPQAFYLERLNNLYFRNDPDGSKNINPILCCGNMLDEISLEAYIQVIDLICVPGSTSTTRLASLVALKEVQGDEWMYELEQGNAKDPYAATNKAFEAILDGASAEAEELLTAHLAAEDEKGGTKEATTKDEGVLFAAAQLRTLLDQKVQAHQLGELQKAFCKQ